MKTKIDYQSKFDAFVDQTLFASLESKDAEFVRDKAFLHLLSFQEFKHLVDMAIDFNMWGEPDIAKIWPAEGEIPGKGRDLKKKILERIDNLWHRYKTKPSDYSGFAVDKGEHKSSVSFREVDDNNTILGTCPVSSEKTRCCQLLTLDAIRNCGFDCSYCCIQTFYTGNEAMVDLNLEAKLKKLELDPQEIYHIGTGQSSDSLLWGNKGNTLDHLLDFARSNPNVILELKTKSDNISHLLKSEIPANVITTWTLNSTTIVENEEHGTVSWRQRLASARKVADSNRLVGFHFHPMVYYKNWEREYSELFKAVMDNFDPHEVAMISFGTLTYIKPVVRKIRKRNFKSKILQMPLKDADGKLSYSDDIKQKLFEYAFKQFAPWRDETFFYFCMESNELWRSVFGYEYESNDAFEDAMKKSYMEKIDKKRGLHNI